METAALEETEIRRRLDSHLIPFEPILEEMYERFLQKRAEMRTDGRTPWYASDTL